MQISVVYLRKGKLNNFPLKREADINSFKVINSSSFKNFIFCIGYMGDQIKEFILKKKLPINISFSDSGLNAGILKRLYDAKDLIDETILMTYGDTFADLNLNNLFYNL